MNSASATSVAGQCLCGTVQIEIDIPARWAWHDHSGATRRAHGAAWSAMTFSRIAPSARLGRRHAARAGPTAKAKVIALYATYVGSWRRRFRVTKGRTKITRFKDETTGTTRSFCARCGTPIAYERTRSPHMVNVPRALFSGRTGREPRYHIAIGELQDWTYRGERLVPLKGFPGVVWERPTGRKRRQTPDDRLRA